MIPNLDDLEAQLNKKFPLDFWTDKGELQPSVGAIFSHLKGIGELKGVSPDTDFRWRDCEVLLEQASALLDRALLDRGALQSAGEKMATYIWEVQRSSKLVAITSLEKADHRFETPNVVSKAQYDSAFTSHEGLKNQVDSTSSRQTAYTNFSDHIDIQSNRIGDMSYLNIWKDEDTFKTPSGWPTQFGDRVQTAYDLTNQIEQDDRSIRKLEMKADIEALTAQRDALAASLIGLQAQWYWDDKNQTYLASRADVESESLALKIAMGTMKWFLDFPTQMSSIEPRYQQSVRDAYDRLVAVNTGMKNLYGWYAQGKPSPVEPLPALIDDDEKSVDSIIAWVRKTATWLAALTRRTHNYVLPISVKKQAGATTWSAGLKDGSWKFNLLQTSFNQQCYVRLRGVAGWVVGGDQDALWTLNVQLPTNATFVYEPGKQLDGKGGGDENKPLDQGRVGCRISGVTTRARKQYSDIVGLTSCYNASPIGNDWVVQVSDAFDPTANGRPDDVQLDLYLAVLLL